MGNTPCSVCRRMLDAAKCQNTANTIIAAMPNIAQPFSANSVCGVYLPSQSTSLPINWNSRASIMPMPAVNTASANIHGRTSSKLLQIKRNVPLAGVFGDSEG